MIQEVPYIERVTPFDYRLFQTQRQSHFASLRHILHAIFIKPNYICIFQRFILGGYVDLTIEIRMIGRLLESNTQ
jgi:hypothetical protein